MRRRPTTLRRAAPQHEVLADDLATLDAEHPLDATDAVVYTNAYGKPGLPGVKDLHFNVSHAGDWVVCAVSHQELGVDVERLRDIDLRLAERFFHASEVRRLAQAGGTRRRDLFFELWTAKEAFLKADGRGLQRALDSFWVEDDGQGGQHIVADDAPRWCVERPRLDNEHKLALCTRPGSSLQGLKCLSLAELSAAPEPEACLWR